MASPVLSRGFIDGEEDSSYEGEDNTDDFEPSKLGTKEYWDDTYARELETFRDIGDVGEIWFGKESIDRIVTWLKNHNFPKDSSVLDIGTGNGMLLVEMARNGFTNLTGIDYSSASIELSRSIMRRELHDVKIQEEDFLNPSTLRSVFDLCIDKGTFDAVSLNPNNSAEKQVQYIHSLRSVLRIDGLFIITSCNWTKEQLKSIFCEGFEILQELPTPKFQFGGKTGTTVSALVLKRNK
ncbi:EEF1A lysine methyltransferase 2 [Erpetoichthys calabaricus]|uniref:EEF1A lysine methyltransferase 2 n=1 Tax=Erpetoichthys calabaricus TaxID=27687 RepID=UPI002233F05B|nr:EEF1A lysine methyltransferase 2 [Erpetoichthys calabaricus]